MNRIFSQYPVGSNIYVLVPVPVRDVLLCNSTSKIKLDGPEVIVRPDVEGIGLLDTVGVHKVVRLGEQAVDAILPDRKRSTAWPNRIRRKYFPSRQEKNTT